VKIGDVIVYRHVDWIDLILRVSDDSVEVLKFTSDGEARFQTIRPVDGVLTFVGEFMRRSD